MNALWLLVALGLAVPAAALLYRHFCRSAVEGPIIVLDTVVCGLLLAGSLIALAHAFAS